MSESIVLYTHPDWSYSDALKEELTDLALDFEEINLALNPEVWEKVEELTGGERITPVMVTGDNVEVGFHGVGWSYWENVAVSHETKLQKWNYVDLNWLFD